jgi:hypothetical protein
MPLALVVPAVSDVPAKLKGQLAGKKVIIWCNIARLLLTDWPLTDLGPGPQPEEKK